GANSAGQGAMFFSRFASQVTILVRGSSMSGTMSRYLVDQIDETKNIRVRTRTTVQEVSGEEKLETITIKNRDTGDINTVPAAALFIFIGAAPHTNLVDGVVERNRAGFILTGPDLHKGNGGRHLWPLKRDPFLLETSVPGIFAAGDVRQGAIRRVATAVGEGAIAISFVHQYLKTV
ncbi:MAG: NAD(P)/FAD-dependent oxidoreductase, partial [Chloroflexi bacterium]|nr:NAD(P)/FAD-dependent oxidoreductase [Chloroflexota bacterium]